jgi:hypothetical protein
MAAVAVVLNTIHNFQAYLQVNERYAGRLPAYAAQPTQKVMSLSRNSCHDM